MRVCVCACVYARACVFAGIRAIAVNVTETESGGKTSSRTSQALTTVTSRGLTEHVTVKRLIDKANCTILAAGTTRKVGGKKNCGRSADSVEVEEEELEVVREARMVGKAS